ncbi:MAG TPA: hypothetical protein VFN92_02605 [Solirubrobacterales bacterium]|nr:hypothetical protein [Solirubrobacterales bacterium]
MFGGEFTDANALSALLTVESLLFATLSVAVSFSKPGSRIPNLPLAPQQLGYFAAGFISIIAFGALMAWWSIFTEPWPCEFRGSVIALAIGLAIIGQPIFAWAIARGLGAKE